MFMASTARTISTETGTPGPNWTEITSAISAAAAALLLAVTLIYAVRQLRDARRTRHGQLLTELSRRWDEPLIVESQQLFGTYSSTRLTALFEKIYLAGGATPAELDDFSKLQALPGMWETLGVLEAEGAIELSVIDRMWGTSIVEAWESWQEATIRVREITDSPRVFENFERLATALRKYKRKERLAGRLAATLRARKRGPLKALRTKLQLRSLLHRKKDDS